MPPGVIIMVVTMPAKMNPEVDRWFEAASHPMTAAMQAVREAILSADARVEESIKWKPALSLSNGSPTFSFKGNIASINPQAKRYVSLMFHAGAHIPGEFPSLHGGGATVRYMQFENVEAVAIKREELQAIVRAWCAMKDEDGKGR